MAAKVTLNVVWGGRRETVRVAANTTLAQVRDQVCAGWGVAAADAAAAVFAVRKRALDMALPLRLAGLASGQTLDLVFAGPRRGGGGASSAASSSVVAVQLPSGVRVQGTFPGATSVWDVLCDAERKAGVCVTRCSCGGGQQQQQQLCYAMPVVVLLGRETAGDVALRATSLAQLGAASGPVLLRVLLRPTQEPLSEALARIDAGPLQQQQQQQDLAPAAESTTAGAATVAVAQTPTPPMPAAAELVLGDEERRRRIEAAVEDERRAAERAEADALETRRAMAAAAEARRLAAERQRTPTPPQQQQRSSEEARARERESRLLAQWQLDDSAMAAEREQEASEAAKAIAATLVQNAQASAEAMQQEQQQAGTAGAAEKDVPEEERGVTVYPPSDTPFDAAVALADIPDSFYELTADDLSEILAEERRTKAEASVLMTREMRERIRAKHWNQFKRCNIRVRFPDQVEIQRTFLPRATISEVEAVVRECLANSDNEFILFTAPPVQHLSDKSKTLLSLHFVPAALLHLKWKRPESVQHPFLKADLMGRIAERLPPNWSFSITAAVAASSASASTGPRCAGCLASGLPLAECVECDNSFCAACWSQVHQDERANHHRRSKHQQTTQQQQQQQQDEPKQKRKLGVPTWFSKGRRF